MNNKIILISLITYFSVGLMHANNYVWLHGLYDNSNCWKIYNEALTSGIGIQSYYICSYSNGTSYSIPQIAYNVWNNTNNIYQDKNGNTITYHPGETNYMLANKSDMILIGHSLGGLVARELDAHYNSNGNIKGIITIGTPHQGAAIENQLANGGVKKLAGDVYDKLTNSIISTLACLPGGLFMCIDAQNLADFYKTALLDSLMGSYLNGGSLSEQDLQEGSTFINNLPNVNVPILCFAAEEDRWAIARLAYCASNKDTLQSNPTINANGTFDQTGYDLMLAGVGACYAVGGFHASVAAGLALAGVSDPVLWYLSALNAVASYNWFATADYLNNGLDYDLGVMVGNCYYEPHSYCYTGLVCQDTPPPPPIEEVGGMKRVTDPVCTLVPGTICTSWTVAVPIGNDGIVSTYAQTLKPEQGLNVIIPSSTIKGVNHMEEFNHYKTKEEFRKVINGLSYDPPTFQK